MEITVQVPGAAGEFVQGMQNGAPFLVTCPIACYTTVRVSTALTGVQGLGAKAAQALQRVLQHFGARQLPAGMQLQSDLPPGKGMSSSTADICAVAAAAAQALGHTLSPVELLQLACHIEPSDGVMLPGWTRINQQTGYLYAQYQDWPELAVTVYDTGGAVYTQAFHARQISAGLCANAAVTQACKLLRQGTAADIGQAALLSAQANQAVLPKAGLTELWQAAEPLGAVGITAAHSGTVLGVLWPVGQRTAMAQQQAQRTLQDYVNRQLPQLACLGTYAVVPGGVRIHFSKETLIS